MAEEPMLRRVVNVLLGLQMLAEGSTYRYDKERTSSTGEAPIPVSFTADGDVRREWSPYEEHRYRISCSRTTVDLEQRVLDAEQALKAARTGAEKLDPEVPDKPNELRLWVLVNCKALRATEVAGRTGMSVSWVRDLRQRSGQHPNGERA